MRERRVGEPRLFSKSAPRQWFVGQSGLPRQAVARRARPGGDHKSKAIEAHRDWLLAVVVAEPDLTTAEIQVRLKETHGLAKSTSCQWRFFARHQGYVST
jgi:hypothetical protein